MAIISSGTLSVSCCFLILPLLLYGQKTYKNGYIIKDGMQINCLINDEIWKNNPTSIDVKLNDTSSALRYGLDDISGFGVGDEFRYQRALIKIDQTEKTPIAIGKYPKWEENQVFLSVLIEGAISLYYYESGSIKRFFYDTPQDSPIQLVYKQYLSSEQDRLILENKTYLSQLWEDVSCTDNPSNRLPEYDLKDLKRYFRSYYACRNEQYLEYDRKIESLKFSASIKPGVEVARLTAGNDKLSRYKHLTFGRHTNVRIGLELEALISFNNYKGGIVIEGYYRHYESTETVWNSSVRFESIDLAISPRYYLLKNIIGIFTELGVFYSLPINSKINLEFTEDLPVEVHPGIFAGIGCTWDRWSISSRYNFKKRIVTDYIFWDTNYTSYQIIIGFQFFRT